MKNCAVYTRVSTTMQAEKEYNSCEAQRDKILSYVKSQEDLKIYKEYSDPGFSGSNLDRPGLNELLRDIAAGSVQAVLTYKIDRLTRSSKDFYGLIDFFEKYGVSYVSVTEHFDTSSPSGRLLRNIMLTFAQFEREMTVERIKDKMTQRAEKGMWNGGGRPFGYKSVNKKLAMDKKEAEIVRQIFERFVISGSLMKTIGFIKDSRFKDTYSKCPSSVGGVSFLLRNPLYVGHMRWADKLYQGQHEPIIAKELFDEAQSLTKEKQKNRKLYKEFLLSGLVRCADCGCAMTNSFTNKKEKRYYYYKCYKTTTEGKDACKIKEVSAPRLEEFVINELTRISKDSQYIENLSFKIAHESPYPSRFELKEELVKKLSNSISLSLSAFKNDVGRKPQVEKCLILRKTIQKIKYSKESLEVIISLGDAGSSPLGSAAVRQSGKRAARTRGAEANPTPRACIASSSFQYGGGGEN